MGEIEIIGVVVVGLAALLGLLSVFTQLIIKPVNDLTVSVTQLVETVKWVNANHGKLEAKIETHDTRLDSLERRVLSDIVV